MPSTEQTMRTHSLHPNPARGPAAALSLLLLGAVAAQADYPSTILADQPSAYYRLNDSLVRSITNSNSGSLGAAGNATNINALPFPGAIAGDGNRSQFYNSAAWAEIPWQAALNPTNTQPFTVEAWFYPSSDQINGGQAVIMNRYSYSGVDRQGWVIFQRAQNDSYVGQGGYEGVGWNFRMFRGAGSSSGLDVVSGVPFQIGKWTHVVTVYDPLEVTNATLTIYIDGVPANTNIWASDVPGYVANTDDHDPVEAPNGPAGLALGAYNNTTPGSNPYFGGVDEFAFYSAKLSPAQILAHYQNGTNSARAVPYSTLIQSDNPVAYLKLDELAPGADIAINMGDLRAAGAGANTAEVVHPRPSALAGRTDDGSFGYHRRNGSATTTMPWLAANNPGAGVPFTFETWLRPMSDAQGGQCPFNNRFVGGTARTGWVIFQRNPNLTYPVSEGHGWNFRMFDGASTSGRDVLTDADYTIGEWQHLVVTWEPQTDNGDPLGNGNNQWEGILTAYVNGVATASNSAALYAANREVPEDGSAPADLGVGSYNAKSTLGSNPFEGDIDEFAFYNNYILTPEQILSHYQAGTNSHSVTNYETLVLTAAYDGATQRLMPATYLRFNDPAFLPSTNQGTLGYLASGSLVVTTNDIPGPVPPAFPGFEASNQAAPFNGAKSWINLNNPAGLNISGQITLEAWVQPGATQGDVARIISHGPPILSAFLTTDPPVETNAAPTAATEVFLRIDGAGANYAVGVSDGTNTSAATFPVPAGDLGTNGWIYLAGTYDGANWKLFRNGVEVATAASATGALPVDDGAWAIGSTGSGWENIFSGGIDEVAIYNRALTPAQVQAHFNAGVSGGGSLTLTIGRTGNTATINWTSGTLQQSDAVPGGFTNVSGATPPSYVIPAGTGTKFYRLSQ